METLKVTLIMVALLALSFPISPQAYSYPSDVIAGGNDTVITFDSVRNELSADGEWIKVTEDEIDAESVTDGSTEFDDDINTEYVWRPYGVDENWSPYTNGYWVYTNCGWMWVSYYHWGWRPYHYGRWWFSPIWGWVWSPGFVWAPAWVVWMFWGDYCGWYPLSPRVRWRHHHHHHGYYCGHVRFRVRHWRFCRSQNFAGEVINTAVIVPPGENAEILKYSKFASNIDITNEKVVNIGPNVREIEKSAGKKFAAEDVTKYNNTKTINKYIRNDVDDKQTYKDNQTKQDVRTNTDKQANRDDKQYEQKETYKEKESYNKKQEDYDKKRNDEKKSNESYKKNNGYKEEKSNDNKGKNDSYKSEKKQDSKTYSPPPDNREKNNSPPPNKKSNDDINKGNDDNNRDDGNNHGNRK
jgi:hypothetical protein